MAYDVGTDYNALEGLQAFQHYYSGRILLGFTPPPEAWGHHSYSRQDVTALLQTAIAKGAAGAMLFSLRKGVGPGAFNPFVNAIAAVTERPPK